MVNSWDSGDSAAHENDHMLTHDVTGGLWKRKVWRKKFNILKKQNRLAALKRCRGYYRFRHWRALGCVKKCPKLTNETQLHQAWYLTWLSAYYLIKKKSSANDLCGSHSCRTTRPPYSSASDGLMSAWCLRATRAWALMGGWSSSSGSQTRLLLTPRSPSSMTSPWRTGWSASSPTGLSFTRWGGVTNKDRTLMGLLCLLFSALTDNEK